MEKQLGLSGNTAKLHQVFGKKLYSDKYSFISEICQNAVDSHRSIGQTDPVEVGIKLEKGDYIFYVRDTGKSFDSREHFEKTVCTILESEKSTEKTSSENCQMGEHGIGSISVSAFKPEWKYTVVKNGRKFNAILKEVEGVGLTHNISEYEETTEDKYVLFEVLVGSSLGYDTSTISLFIENMKRKLCYFKDIMFQFDPTLISRYRELLTLNSEFKIFQTDDIQISTLSKNADMHICLDQYYYPINWERLGMKPIHLNIGLKFSMADGLNADLTRENLQYTIDYELIIKKKIEKVSTWFIKRYNKNIPDELTSVKKYIELVGSSKRVNIEGVTYIIDSLLPFSLEKCKEIEFKDVNDKVIQKFLSSTSNGKNLYFNINDISNTGSKIKPRYWMHWQHDKKILVDIPISKKMASYINSEYKGAGLYKKNKICLEKVDLSYTRLLGLCSKATMRSTYLSSGINLWRDSIRQAKLVEDSIEKDYLIKVSNIKIPANFNTTVRKTPNKKEKVSLVDMSGEIGVKYCKPMDKRSSDWSCKFEERIIKVKDLYSRPFFHVYGTEDKRRKLDLVYRLFHDGTTVKACIVTERQQTYLKQLKLHNFMEVDEFFKGKHKTVGRGVTAYLIDKMMNEYLSTFRNKEIIGNFLSSKFRDDLEKLQKYAKVYCTDISHRHEDFMKDLVDLVDTLKLYDSEIWETYNKVKEDIDKFDFVDFFALGGMLTVQKGNTYQEKSIRAMHDIARQRTIKMNWKYYKMDFDK